MATATIASSAATAKETFHFVNDPSDAIPEALTGLTHLHPSLSLAPAHKTIYRNDLQQFAENHVTSIGFSGGGHEPMFGGFVGHGFLSAYVSGAIFASPTAAQIFEAIRLCQPTVGAGKGTLIVCGNYTGDILNAGLAITRAKAAGYRVHFVPVGDDVAVGRKKGGKVGRRGLSGHLIALKCACALAERGEDLHRVAEVMEYVASNVGTIGVAFDRRVEFNPQWICDLADISAEWLFRMPESQICRHFRPRRSSSAWAHTASLASGRFRPYRRPRR